MPVVEVPLGARSYPVVVEPESLERAGELVARHAAPAGALVVSHPAIAEAYGGRLLESLHRAGIDAHLFLVPTGDRYKSLTTASRVLDAAVRLGLERASAFIALGGGMVGDLAGFAASIYMRGVAFVQVPTSLLAQVDASVGGKTAVNHRAGKNLLGTFYQPRLVVADPAVLRTLPTRELRCGLAEMVKHGMILSAPYFHRLEALMPALLRRDVEAMTEAVAGSCALKAAVVASDEREAGERALLNYGHTFGHALETVTGFRRFRHGEAVSLGMEMAASLAQDLGLLPADAAAAQRRLLRAAGLPVALRGKPSFGAGELLAAMRHDKKVARGRLRFVLATGLGRGEVRADVPEEAVWSVCQRFLATPGAA